MPEYPVLIPPVQVGSKLFSDRVSLSEDAAKPLIELGILGKALPAEPTPPPPTPEDPNPPANVESVTLTDSETGASITVTIPEEVEIPEIETTEGTAIVTDPETESTASATKKKTTKKEA